MFQKDGIVEFGTVIFTKIAGCLLDVVGTPIQHAQSPFNQPTGAWMRDAAPRLLLRLFRSIRL